MEDQPSRSERVHPVGLAVDLRHGPPWSGPLAPLRYAAHVHDDGQVFRVELPDAPGCWATALGRDAALEKAAVALRAWLRTRLASGGVLLRPGLRRDGDGLECTSIYPAPRLALAVSLRMLRQENAWSTAELAALAGLSRRDVETLEDPDGEATPAALARAVKAVCVLPSRRS